MCHPVAMLVKTRCHTHFIHIYLKEENLDLSSSAISYQLICLVLRSIFTALSHQLVFKWNFVCYSQQIIRCSEIVFKIRITLRMT